MTDQADEIAREIVISASRKILLKGDEWITLARKENADVFAAELAAALRSCADAKLEEARSALQAIIDRCGNDPVFADRSIGLEAAVAAIVSLKSKEPQP